MSTGSRLRSPAIQLPLAIGLWLVFLTLFHNGTIDVHPLLHEVSQRLFYLPIVYAAYRYGFSGGLLSAIVASGLFLPHLGRHLHEAETLRNQIAEIIMFLTVGAATGMLSTLQKREHRRYVETAGQLQKAYDELKQTTTQLMLSDRLASLGQLSAVLAHEVRNPLASIKGAVEVLETEISWDHPKRQFLEAIRIEADRLNKLVNEFLQFARPSQPEILPVQPNAVVRSVAALVAKQAAKSGIRLVTHLGEELPAMLMDGEQIKQALLNLVINAMQAMPEGGSLDLTAARHGDTVILQVADSGHGIPAEIRDRLFVPFVTTRKGGTGLGLAIAHRLVVQHEGTIRARDREGGGSIFEIELPVAASVSEQPVAV